MVATQQLARVPRHQMADRRVRSHDGQRRAALRRLELTARNAGAIPQRTKHPFGQQAGQTGDPPGIGLRHLAELPFSGAKQPHHPFDGIDGWTGLRDVFEEPQERRRRPVLRQAQQTQQIPDFDGMDLHRRRRQQQQPVGTVLQVLHQPQQGVRPAFLRRARRAPAGVMSLVQHHQIPRRGILQQDLRPLTPPHQLTGGDDDRFRVPRIRVDRARLAPAQGRRGVPHELAPVVDRPVQVELLAQLDLPLAQHRLRRQDQDPSGASGEPSLAQQQAGLDGLAQPHLVGDQQPRRPVGVEALERPDLMRPGDDRGRSLADARAPIRQRRRPVDEGPDAAAQIDYALGAVIDRRSVRFRRGVNRGGHRRLLLGIPQARRLIALGHEAHQVPAHRLGRVQHDHAVCLVPPDTREVGLLVGHSPRLRTPARVDVDALPVVPPAGRGLVEAAVPGQPIAGAVRHDAGLLVKDAVRWNRSPFRVARDGHLHVEITARHHPGEQFQRVGSARVGRRQRPLFQVTFDPVTELLALLDGFDLVRRERAPDDETHVAAVADQPLDAAGGQRKRPGVEIAGQPVVALRVFERRYVEQTHQIAVVGRVLALPCASGEHRSADTTYTMAKQAAQREQREPDPACTASVSGGRVQSWAGVSKAR